MSSVKLLKSKKRALFKSHLQQLRHKNPCFRSINSALAKNLLNLNIDEGRQQTIASYFALPGEISPFIFEQKSQQKLKFVFPTLREKKMVFVPSREKWRGTSKAKFGPKGDKELKPVWDIDIFLVPGLAFDLAGRRLGRGAGHYDRFLAQKTGLKVGLAHHFQILNKALPEESHDIRMDVIVTEQYFFIPIHKNRDFFNKWLG